LIELILISLMSKFNAKHDPSGYVAIPACQYVEKLTQIDRRLYLISHSSFAIDQPITPCAIFEPTDPYTVQR